MLKIVDLTTTVEFESARDPDKGTDKATKFKLGAIPSRVYAALKDKATKWTQNPNSSDGVSAEFRPNLIGRDIVRFGVKGIENYPVKFATQKESIGSKEFDVLADAVIDAMDIDTIRELSTEIQKLCEFNEEEVKNSEG